MRKRAPAGKQQAPQVREVTGIKSLASLVEEGWSFGLSLDPPTVREHMDGSWTVEYPEEGFIQTSINQKWPVTESSWPGASGDSKFDLEAALAHARAIKDGEPKIVKVMRPRSVAIA